MVKYYVSTKQKIGCNLCNPLVSGILLLTARRLKNNSKIFLGVCELLVFFPSLYKFSVLRFVLDMLLN